MHPQYEESSKAPSEREDEEDSEMEGMDSEGEHADFCYGWEGAICWSQNTLATVSLLGDIVRSQYSYSRKFKVKFSNHSINIMTPYKENACEYARLFGLREQMNGHAWY